MWQLQGHNSLCYTPIFANQPTNKPFINRFTGEFISGLTNMWTYQINKEFNELIKDYPNNFKKFSQITIKFIADCFSKSISPTNHLNYIFSAFFADKFLNKVESEEFDAIVYPSVQDRLNSENLAIKADVFDKNYRLIEVKESFVIQDPSDGRGGYFMDGTANCKSFDYDGNKILWDDNKFSQSNERLAEIKEKYKVDFT